MVATVHLQKARLTGGILSLIPRAIKKFPDQMIVANAAYTNPIHCICFKLMLTYFFYFVQNKHNIFNLIVVTL